MKKFSSIVILLVCINFSSFAKENTIQLEGPVSIPDSAQVISYPQMHRDRGTMYYVGNVKNYDMDVVFAQWILVGKIIQAKKIHSNLKVFSENSIFNMTKKILDDALEDYFKKRKEKMGDQTKGYFQKTIDSIFPSGFPENFEELSAEQQILLHDIGGVKVALALGFIDQVYKTITKEEHDRIISKIFHLRRNSKEWNDLVITQRERILKREVEEVLNKKGGKAFIVFGANHDLSSVFNKNNFFRIPFISTVHINLLKIYFLQTWIPLWLTGRNVSVAILKDQAVQNLMENNLIIKDLLKDQNIKSVRSLVKWLKKQDSKGWLKKMIEAPNLQDLLSNSEKKEICSRVFR